MKDYTEVRLLLLSLDTESPSVQETTEQKSVPVNSTNPPKPIIRTTYQGSRCLRCTGIRQ